ncbi:MAG TPA: hypothetical protein VLX92_01925, partial [Kofleriaceae bacterium]|nr:hypothetical protein [Kofleriaceae bacterium]
MWRLVIVVSAGCTVQVASPPLAIEPSAIELTIDPAVPPPPVALVVREGDDDVTALASWSFAGRTLGTLDAAGFTSDGRTGGATAIVATIDGRQAQIAATVRVVGRRSVAGLPPGASDWLDAATPVAVDAQLEPGDGAVLPPGLGHLDVDF